MLQYTEKQQSTSNVDIPENNFSEKPAYAFVKRLVDIVVSALFLILLSPVFLIIVILILLDDKKGQPIFSQIRCGKNGKQFRIYKFRTMCIDAEDKLKDLQSENEMDGPVFKIKHDPRITRIGKFLRATSIDEFPQLVNILLGDMSFVGPRPALPDEVAEYSERDKFRLKVTPGLTCYWQITPNRNSITFDEWMELDRKYILERSLLLDFKLFFKTIIVVFKKEGC
ncbi:MAG: sugar transferase [Acutalibacteraceae bacterium]|nr:sugar transferase [Acutalibacteraceae bacterium]